MGLSVAASSAILFVGFLFMATALFMGLTSTLTEIGDSLEEAYDARADFGSTNIQVENATNNTTTVFVNVTNNGGRALKVSEIQLLINGSMATNRIFNSSVSGNNVTDIWGPDEVLFIEAAYTSVGSERIMIITGNGVRDVEVLT